METEQVFVSQDDSHRMSDIWSRYQRSVYSTVPRCNSVTHAQDDIYCPEGDSCRKGERTG